VSFHFSNMVLDVGRRELRSGSNLLKIEPQVFDLLEFLIRNRDRAVSRDDLVAAVWNGRIVSDSAIDARINAARRAVGDSGAKQRLIKTLPRKGFRFVGVVREEPATAPATPADTAVERSKPPLDLPDRPSIAVLAFANFSGDPSQDYFSDGITEDIITELSRFPELFVIARNSSFQYKTKPVDVRRVAQELGVRYVLEGSIRRASNRVRISAQLIDAASGTHRWADRYDRKFDDVFAVQDDVVRTIVAMLAANVNKAEFERMLSKPPTSWQAYDHHMCATAALTSFWRSFEAKHLYEARRLVERALVLDASYARAYGTLSNTYHIGWLYPLDDDYLNSAALAKAYELALKAVQLDPNLPQAHADLGSVLAWKAEHDAALAAFEKAIVLNPNLTDWRYAFALVLAGESAKAIECLKTHMRLDPFYGPYVRGILGLACFMLKRYPKAIAHLRECISRAPDLRSGRAWSAATYAQAGHLDKARVQAREVLRIDPSFAINRSPVIPTLKRPEDAKHLADGLRKAGLPER
jgi:adenylate cyclase